MIPYLKSAELIAVTGEMASTATDRLRVDGATDGVRCTVFFDSVYVEPALMAAVMRQVAREIGEASIIQPFPYRAAAMIRLADLHVFAPADTGNRVWLIPRDGNAFSVTLPDFTGRECLAIIPALLGGAVFDDPRLARPRVVKPTHRASEARH